MMAYEQGKFRSKKAVFEIAITEGRGVMVLNNKQVFITTREELLQACKEVVAIGEETKQHPFVRGVEKILEKPRKIEKVTQVNDIKSMV